MADQKHRLGCSRSPALQVLDLACWAPSGDNLQPWRFELLGPEEFAVILQAPSPGLKHDLDGLIAELSIGALLETVVIAAAGLGMNAEIQEQHSHKRWNVKLCRCQGRQKSALFDMITQRRVHRGALSTDKLTQEVKEFLIASLDSGYEVRWFESVPAKWSVTQLLFLAAQIRLTMPEAREVHNAIIEWDAAYSLTRIPEAALGASWLTRFVMRWALQRWERVHFLNRYLAGTWLPRIEMEVRTGMLCGAHFAILAPHPVESVAARVTAGRNMQRFWLTSASVGLQLQPEFAPIVFSRYARGGADFTAEPSCLQLAPKVDAKLVRLMGDVSNDRIFFLGRLGFGSPQVARSLRESVERKLI